MALVRLGLNSVLMLESREEGQSLESPSHIYDLLYSTDKRARKLTIPQKAATYVDHFNSDLPSNTSPAQHGKVGLYTGRVRLHLPFDK